MNRIYALLALVLVAAAAVVVVAAQNLPQARQSELWFEGAKAAIGVVPLAVFGLLVNDFVKRRDLKASHDDRDRDAARARLGRDNAARHSFRREAIDAYNKSKAVRRALRGAGLRRDAGIDLSAEMLAHLDDQMRALGEAQLEFERLKREVQPASAPFREREKLELHLLSYEKDLAGVIHEWEARRPLLKPGAAASDLGEWPAYSGFVATVRQLGPEPSSSEAFKDLERALLNEIDAVVD